MHDADGHSRINRSLLRLGHLLVQDPLKPTVEVNGVSVLRAELVDRWTRLIVEPLLGQLSHGP